MKSLIILFIAVFSINAFAQLTNESSLGLVIVSGNVDSSTTNAKQETTYKWDDSNKVSGKGKYTEVEEDGEVTANSWSAMLRYDRSLSERSSLFAAHTWEANRFAGYIQRNTAEAGYSYMLIQRDYENWSADLSYSYRVEDFQGSDDEEESPGVSVGSKYEYTKAKVLTYAIDLKYRHDLQSDEDFQNHTLEVEPSISSVLTDIFSLKVGYLVKYQSRLLGDSTEHTDTTLSTNLVAKF